MIQEKKGVREGLPEHSCGRGPERALIMQSRIICALMLSALAGSAQQPRAARTVASNYPSDLYGPVDTRMAGCIVAGGPCIWGHADSSIFNQRFYPPAGYRVRILSFRGDLIAWIKSLPGDPPTPPESAAGILLGFQSTWVAGADCDYCSAGVPLYIQGSVTQAQPNTREPFDYEDVGLILGADNILQVKLAEYLNTTGKPIHLEATYVVRFEYTTQVHETPTATQAAPR